MRRPILSRFVVIWMTLAPQFSCAFTYSGTVLKTYPGPELGRGESALLVWNQMWAWMDPSIWVTEINGAAVRAQDKDRKWAFVMERKDDEARQFMDLSAKNEPLEIYQLTPGPQVVTIMSGSDKLESDRFVKLRFEARAGRVYRAGRSQGWGKGKTFLDVWVSDVTDGTPVRVSQ